MYIVLCALLWMQAPDVMRVQEDWELVLNVPDGDVQAPQFHTVMSPFTHTDSLFAQTTWNYRELPAFQPGGLQLQGWNGDNFLAKKDFGGGKFSSVSETVTWTQLLATNGTQTGFYILNGQSTTWGSFGGASMSIVGNFPLPNLNSYDPGTSAGNAYITYGANRVTSLKIKEIRYYDAGNNLISVDTTQRVVHQQ